MTDHYECGATGCGAPSDITCNACGHWVCDDCVSPDGICPDCEPAALEAEEQR